MSQIRNALHDLPCPGVLPRFVVVKYGPYRNHFETCAEKPAKGIMIGLFSLSKIHQSFREAV